jgi:hypothetical protein
MQMVVETSCLKSLTNTEMIVGAERTAEEVRLGEIRMSSEWMAIEQKFVGYFVNANYQLLMSLLSEEKT